jgi:protein-S-isoprenylcysteine O-methyltransferase Ste14
MSVKENIKTTFGVIGCAIIVGYFTVFIPHTIITSENDLCFEIGKFRFTGLILIFAGVFGYLWCFLNFIIDAKGTPLPLGSQKHLIIKGLYRFVRNPMYLSAYLFFWRISLFPVFFIIILFVSLDCFLSYKSSGVRRTCIAE